ncbi:hypothetical protein ACJMK2_002253 [Sinanodonta woodiana]|uniref:C2H2-type domain-containing protein n=1 Tax=Sinanodonta woodiana TaxID=1069815 RepID=A0ABD3XUP3_SINWO
MSRMDKHEVSSRLEEAVLSLCKESFISYRNVEVDAIICISVADTLEDHVIKIHEKLRHISTSCSSLLNSDQGFPAHSETDHSRNNFAHNDEFIPPKDLGLRSIFPKDNTKLQDNTIRHSQSLYRNSRQGHFPTPKYVYTRKGHMKIPHVVTTNDGCKLVNRKTSSDPEQNGNRYQNVALAMEIGTNSELSIHCRDDRDCSPRNLELSSGQTREYLLSEEDHTSFDEDQSSQNTSIITEADLSRADALVKTQMYLEKRETTDGNSESYIVIKSEPFSEEEDKEKELKVKKQRFDSNEKLQCANVVTSLEVGKQGKLKHLLNLAKRNPGMKQRDVGSKILEKDPNKHTCNNSIQYSYSHTTVIPHSALSTISDAQDPSFHKNIRQHSVDEQQEHTNRDDTVVDIDDHSLCGSPADLSETFQMIGSSFQAILPEGGQTVTPVGDDLPQMQHVQKNSPNSSFISKSNSPGKIHPCRHCGTLFSSLRTRNRHESTTCGSNRFECSVCLKWFSRSDARRRHMLKFHGFVVNKPPENTGMGLHVPHSGHIITDQLSKSRSPEST